MTATLDGNSLGGAMRELFAVDVTAAIGECAGCGRRGAVGEAALYVNAPGLVARCAGCDAVVLRLVRGPDRAWLDLRGLTCLEIRLPDDESDAEAAGAAADGSVR